MNNRLNTHWASCHLFSLVLATSLALPLPALAAVALATSPLQTATASTVLPNVMFMLDDSGSMDWDYMPDDSKNFSGKYGFNTNTCNGVYYNPTITYTPPVTSTGANLTTPNSDSSGNQPFTKAEKSGYKPGTTVDLNTGFTGGSGSGASGINLTPGPAFYYTYAGSQRANWQQDFHNTNSVFYKECISNVGSTTAYDTTTDIASDGTSGPHPVNAVFKETVLGSTETAYITINSSVAGGTFTITVSGGSSTTVTGITVGGVQIMDASSTGSSTDSTEATNIKTMINHCTTSKTGNCTTNGGTGFSAVTSGAVITVSGPVAVGATINIATSGTGTDTFTKSAVTPVSVVSGITVNGVQLMLSGSAAISSNTTTTATNISQKINASGYSADSTGNVISITGPTSALGYTPVISYSGTMTYTVIQFPDTDPAKLQNFANWYSYYSNRMLMMKTGVGQAFTSIDNKYRVGFMTMNNNVSPDIVDIAPFDATQKSAWYAKLYASTPGNSTPLREALSHVGQLYAHKFGDYDIYTATITVSGSGSTSVNSVSVMESGATLPVETMAGTTAADTSTTNVAANIAAQINLLDPSNYGASSKNNVVTITGPAAALGSAPVIVNNGGGMSFTVTTFTNITIHAQLNGITPADPVQYSCQQNFVILSTDGYWNGSTTYDLSTPNIPVGNQDGTAPRPKYDGGLFTKTTSQTTQGKYHLTETDTQLQKRTVQVQKNTGTLQKRTGALQWQTNLTSATGALKWATNLKSATGALKWTTKQQILTGYLQSKASGSWANVAAGGTCTGKTSTCRLNATNSLSTVAAPTAAYLTTYGATCTPSGSFTSTSGTSATNTVGSGGTIVSCPVSGSFNPTLTTIGASGSCDGTLPNIQCSASLGAAAYVTTYPPTCTQTFNAAGTSTTDGSGNTTSCTTTTYGTATTVVANGTCDGTKPNVQCSNAGTASYLASPTATCTQTFNGTAASSTADGSGNVTTCSNTGTTYSSWANLASGTCTPGANAGCQYNWGSWSNTASACTVNYSPNTGAMSITSGTDCQYSWSGYANSACTDVPPSTGPNYTVTSAAVCQTIYNNQATPNVDNGWVGAASCANSGPTNGLTVYCNNPNSPVTVNGMNNTPVLSCNKQNAVSPNYVTVTCTTNYDTGNNTLVGSCAQGNSGSPNYIQTTCTTKTVATVNNATTCTPGNSGPPSYIQTTCTGGTGGTADTLADVAMYYYQTDIRDVSLNNCDGAASTDFPSGNPDVCANDVPESQTTQHMTTYTLGLGARGRMVYTSKNYMTDQSGDFYSIYDPKNLGIKADSTKTPPICSWQANGTTCNWPIPASGSINNIDDLWHAAVNGNGTYYSAKDPAELSDGLGSALSSITAKKGAAAAAATSTLNPVAGNNFAYVASYTTLKWTGNLEARTINTSTGVISHNASWCVENIPADTCAPPGILATSVSGNSTTYNCVTPNATVTSCVYPDVLDSVANTCSHQMALACTGTLPPMRNTTSDSRTIKFANSAGQLVDFSYSNLTATQQAYFGATKISGLSQWSGLSAAQQAAAVGANLVNYLRGQNGYENSTSNPVGNRIYRAREAVLGDALESQPSFIAAPTFTYADAGYSAFVAAHASRAGTVYMGTNDGMLHAFDATTGVERWAFVPTAVIPNMWHLADTGYDLAHVNFVNGSPIISDYYCPDSTCPGGAAGWRTILVAGLNGGGREYYALDITDPAAPILMWEFTPANDANLGYTFGLPVVTKLTNNTWVVLFTSGYDNGTDSATPVSPPTYPATFVPNSPVGDGTGYLYAVDAHTGAIVKKLGDNSGSAAAPSGLAKIATRNMATDSNVAGYTYGGDLQGRVWRFDINAAATPFVNPLKFASLKDASFVAQPVTTSPILGVAKGHNIVFVGTGKYLEKSDNDDTQTQTLYAMTDDNVTSTLFNPRTHTSQPRMVPQTISTNMVDPVTGNTIRQGSYNPVNFDAPSYDRGWYVDFPESGERVNIDGKLLLGTLLVPTIVPKSTFCSPGGHGWLNYFDYTDGWPTTDGSGQGAAGTNKNVSVEFDASIVGLNILFIAGKPIVEVVTSDNPTPTIPATTPVFNAGNSNFTGKRMQWRELIP